MKKQLGILLAGIIALGTALGNPVPAQADSFSDVSDSAYYADAVGWAVEEGITSGIGNGRFGSNDSCTRAQIVTFLWKMSGSPEISKASAFSDVSDSAWYRQAVMWAVSKDITAGIGDGKFGPNNPCTRAQIVTFLYKMKRVYMASADPIFIDVSSGAWYYDAAQWAYSMGIASGTDPFVFSPNNTCTRAQAVTFLYQSEDVPYISHMCAGSSSDSERSSIGYSIVNQLSVNVSFQLHFTCRDIDGNVLYDDNFYEEIAPANSECDFFERIPTNGENIDDMEYYITDVSFDDEELPVSFVNVSDFELWYGNNEITLNYTLENTRNQIAEPDLNYIFLDENENIIGWHYSPYVRLIGNQQIIQTDRIELSDIPEGTTRIHLVSNNVPVGSLNFDYAAAESLAEG